VTALSYYIYYRVDAAAAAAGAAAARGLIEAVRVATGVTGRLLRKRGEPLLWMEVYEGVTDAASFERALAQAVASADLQRCLQPGSARHVECFDDAA